MSITAPEGSSFDFTDNYVDHLGKFIVDSVPEKKVLLTVTAPGFSGSGAVNTAFVRLVLPAASERKRSQQQIADFISGNLKRFEARAFVLQEQTISAGGGAARSALPVQFVLQAKILKASSESSKVYG
jgi:multidrug efflux pump